MGTRDNDRFRVEHDGLRRVIRDTGLANEHIGYYLMGTNDKVSAEKAEQLADELSALSKQQSEALHKGAYISMSKEEEKQYDLRRTRISEICTLLGKFRPVESSASTEAPR